MVLTERDCFSKSHYLPFMNGKWERMIPFLTNMNGTYRSASVITIPTLLMGLYHFISFTPLNIVNSR